MIRERLFPWAGVIGGAAGWYLSQQTGSTMVFAGCGAGHWWSVGLLGLLGLTLSVGGALLSYSCWRGDREEANGWRFVSLLGIMVGALLSFPILMQTIAGFLVPSCVS